MAYIELRSDTTTKPTEAMRKAMYEAEVGDEGYGDDPTVTRLEQIAAEKVGKEAAVFCVTGRMANLVGIMSHTNQGHIFWYESPGVSLLPCVQVIPIEGDRMRRLEPAQLKAALRPIGRGPSRRLLCLENTHNRAGGTITPVDRMSELYGIAHDAGLAVHLDGARVFNASTASGVDVREFAKNCDSLMFCLSKGLGAPMGSILCGTREFIEEARSFRKLVGGGLRQVGVVAAAGIVALTTMVDRLAEDHENARRLAEGLANIDGFTVDLESVQTNIVMAEVTGLTADAPTLVAALGKNGLLCTSHTNTRIRLVTHKDVSRREIEDAIAIISATAREYRSA
jgi:threonine aldolase